MTTSHQRSHSKRVFALLIGIDRYAAPSIPQLLGCQRDVELVESYLLNRVEPAKLHLCKLLNERATRSTILEAFNIHLSQAQQEDVILFYFSGHGSQVPAPPVFLESTRWNETIVCYDSRHNPAGWDIADKELRYLISERAKHCSHIVVILDSCHSGTATRGETVRQLPGDARIRQLDDYDILPVEERNRLRLNLDDTGKIRAWNELPRGGHILLAACRPEETAREMYFPERQGYCGLFSHLLLTLLSQNQIPTYYDLWREVHTRVQRRVREQHPYIEETVGSYLHQPFLGGVIAPQPPSYFVHWKREHGWTVDGGAFHGFTPGTVDDPFELALFPKEHSFITDKGYQVQLKESVGSALVKAVFAGESHLEISEGELSDKDETYVATVLKRPLLPYTVHFEGEQTQLRAIRERLAEGYRDGIYINVRETSTREYSDFVLTAENDRYLLQRSTDRYPFVVPIAPFSPANIKKSLDTLEQMTRWLQTAELKNPISFIAPEEITLEFFHVNNSNEPVGEPLRPDDLTLVTDRPRKHHGKSIHYAPLGIQITNHSIETLHFALLDLSDKYLVECLAHGELKSDGEPFRYVCYLYIPPDLVAMGVQVYRDILKVLVSTHPINPTLLELEGLEIEPAQPAIARGVISDPLTRLLTSVRNPRAREALSPVDLDSAWGDWTTREATITLINEARKHPLTPDTKQAVVLAKGLELYGNGVLGAKVQVGNEKIGSRDLQVPTTPPLFRDNPHLSEPFALTTGWDGAAENNVIRLTDITNAESVDADQPLRIRFPSTKLSHDEHLIAYTYDPTIARFIVTGYVVRARDFIELRIERLPTISTEERDPRLAAEIVIRKIIHPLPLGVKYTYPHLALLVSNPAPHEQPFQTVAVNQLHGIRRRIAQAQRILLYIHGWTGDTASMVESGFAPTRFVTIESPALIEGYDAVLAFDYESIHTGIDESARTLKKMLQMVGLGPRHKKQLDIIAHSMGGLVARWLIEREGGYRIVNHLVMLGTPNGGLPWPSMLSNATFASSVFLNLHGQINVWSGGFAFLLTGLELLDTTIDQMETDSTFFEDLRNSRDPGVQYTCIAGDASTFLTSDHQAQGIKSIRDRLLQGVKSKGKKVVHQYIFKEEKNDLFISVASVHEIPDERVPRPAKLVIKATHLNFFKVHAGIQVLLDTLLVGENALTDGDLFNL